MKVTFPSYARENTKAADIAEINVIPLIGIHDPVVTLSDEAQAFAQLASQTSALAKKNRKRLNLLTIKF
jgi:hypothetical protein